MADSLANTWWGFPPLFALFLACGLAFVGWGRFLRARLLPRRTDALGKISESLFLASLFFFGIAFLLSHLGLLNSAGKIVLLACLAAGLVFFYRERAFVEIRDFAKAHRAFSCLLAFILLVRALAAYLPQGHGDPLLYHLLGPRLWVQHGSVYLEANLPNGLLASTWEYLYVWPQLLFYQGRNFAGLIEAQVFCQWLHLTLGWGGAAILLAALLRKCARSDRELQLAVLAALFVPCMQWTAGLAKNDSGIAFWALAALFFFQEALEDLSPHGAPTRLRFFLAGIAAGLALAGKMNALFTLAPGILVLTGMFLRERSTHGKKIAWSPLLYGLAIALAGALAGALPVYLRNFLLTGNPLFSLPLQLFPSPWISKSWSNHFSVHQLGRAAPDFSVWQSRIWELLHEGPGIVALALGLALLLLPYFRKSASRERIRGILAFAGIFGLGYAILASTYAANIELRYLGGGLLLASAAGVLLFVELLRSRLPKKAELPLQITLLAILLASSKLPTHLLWKLQRVAPGEAHVLAHSGGDSRDWIRKNAKPEELVIVMGDNEAYYLSALNVAILTERPDTDAATYGETDPAAFVQNLCRVSQATYLLVTREEFGFAKKFATDAYEPALLFQGAASKVYALAKMERIADAKASAACQPPR